MAQRLARCYNGVTALSRALYMQPCTRMGLIMPISRRMSSADKREIQYAVYDKHDPTPISFSKSAAADKSRRLDPLLGDHDKQSNTVPMIMVAVGFLLCGTLLYSFITAEKMTKEENEEKTLQAMEQLGTLIESAARDGTAQPTDA